MNTFVGNGVDSEITVPATADYIPSPGNNTVVFRKSTSDGSFVPADNTYDAKVIGGNLAYTSAVGVNSSEINIDGDGFITPITSHAPEEVVPGHIVDTVDIKVYDRITSGGPSVVTRYYPIIDTNTIYNIGQQPSTTTSVFVKVNNELLTQDVDFVVNYKTQTIKLTESLLTGDLLVITSFSSAGEEILDFDTVIANGSVSEFVTKARWNNSFSVFVTVDGVTSGVTTYVNSTNNIVIKFSSPPVATSIISYIVSGSDVTSINQIQKETVEYNGIDSTYPLSMKLSQTEPYETAVVVEYNGLILQPSDFMYFNVSGTSRTYTISSTEYPLNSIDTTDINVYLNGNQLEISKDYSWLSASNQLKIKRGIAASGDTIILEIYKGAEYTISKISDTEAEITFTDSYTTGDEFVVTVFSNHEVLGIERTRDVISQASEIVPGVLDYYRFTQMTNGRFRLNSPVIGAEYVWVSLNRELLTPEIDYIIEDNLVYINLSPNISLADGDVVDIILGRERVVRQPFGYKIFKDMLNKTSYIRIDEEAASVLAQPLNYYDSAMVVIDASKLAQPDASVNRPGVVMIDGERIEYFQKSGNTLNQLRRGTSGTGVKTVYNAGTKVYDQNLNQIVPYKDEVISKVSVGDGDTQLIPLEFVPGVSSGTTGPDWYRDTIPLGYGQCDEIEVFVGGRRLRKAPITIWNPEVGQDSPWGDEQFEAEFSVDGITAQIRLTTPPDTGVKIEIQKRVGKIWAPAGSSLLDANTAPAKFIRAKTAQLPQ